MPELYRRAMGIERAIGVGAVEKPPSVPAVGDHIYHATNGIGAESHRHHTLIHLDAVGEAHRDIVESERLSYTLLWHAVDENFHALSAHAIEHKRHIGPYTARFAQFQPRSLGKGIAEAFGGVEHATGIHGDGVESRALHSAHTGGAHHHLFELHLTGAVAFFLGLSAKSKKHSK